MALICYVISSELAQFFFFSFFLKNIKSYLKFISRMADHAGTNQQKRMVPFRVTR